MITEQQREQARKDYIEMKRKAGVPPGKEFFRIVNNKLVPCSEEEYLGIANSRKRSDSSISDKYFPNSVACV